VLTSFWQGIGGKLAERWAASSVAALIFWVGAVAAWATAHGGVGGFARAGHLARGASAQEIIAGLLVVAGSGLVVQRLALPAIRLLEGYWPSRPLLLTRIRKRLIKARSERIGLLEKEFQELASKVHDGSASPDEQRRYSVIDQSLRRVPSDEGRRMPTQLGDILRASETWPLDKYGLDAVKCWPQLWTVLPDQVKQDLVQARTNLDASAGACVWSVLFVVWSFWAWWVAPAGLILAVVVYRVWLLKSAEAFGDLVESAFDVHRMALYQALRWPMPSNPGEERAFGRSLTEYLWRGTSGDTPKFVQPNN
jgi:hypothetical protein